MTIPVVPKLQWLWKIQNEKKNDQVSKKKKKKKKKKKWVKVIFIDIILLIFKFQTKKRTERATTDKSENLMGLVRISYKRIQVSCYYSLLCHDITLMYDDIQKPLTLVLMGRRNQDLPR